jgi:hypothetical protein
MWKVLRKKIGKKKKNYFFIFQFMERWSKLKPIDLLEPDFHKIKISTKIEENSDKEFDLQPPFWTNNSTVSKWCSTYQLNTSPHFNWKKLS